MDSWGFEKSLRRLQLYYSRDVKPQLAVKKFAMSPGERRRAKFSRNEARKKKTARRQFSKNRGELHS